MGAGTRAVTEDERYCAEGFHVRDPLTETCLECGDEKTWEQANAELVVKQPPRGTIVLAQGSSGTAWQRFYGDGRWHSTTGKSTTWDKLVLSDRVGAPTRIVYLPPRVRR